MSTAQPLPFNPPSAVLFQLLGFLVDAGKGVVQTSFEKLEAMHEEIKRQYEGCCGRAVLALADPPQVTFYRDANYAVKLGSFGPGRYNIHTDNDTISSVQVPDGLKLTLYEHAEWQGASKSFTRDAVYVGDDFNDRTSSFVIEYS